MMQSVRVGRRPVWVVAKRRPGGRVGASRGVCLSLLDTPRIVGSGQRSHRRRADAVAAHVHLLGNGKWLAVCAVGDVVVRWEALGLV